MTPLRERVRTVRRNLRVEGPQIARILVAAAVSWQLCVWLGATQPPVFAVVVPLVAMRDAPDSALNVSLARLVGVVAGLSIGIAVLSWLRPSALSVVLVMAVALGVGVVLRIGDTLNLQVAVCRSPTRWRPRWSARRARSRWSRPAPPSSCTARRIRRGSVWSSDARCAG